MRWIVALIVEHDETRRDEHLSAKSNKSTDNKRGVLPRSKPTWLAVSRVDENGNWLPPNWPNGGCCHQPSCCCLATLSIWKYNATAIITTATCLLPQISLSSWITCQYHALINWPPPTNGGVELSLLSETRVALVRSQSVCLQAVLQGGEVIVAVVAQYHVGRATSGLQTRQSGSAKPLNKWSLFFFFFFLYPFCFSSAVAIVVVVVVATAPLNRPPIGPEGKCFSERRFCCNFACRFVRRACWR